MSDGLDAKIEVVKSEVERLSGLLSDAKERLRELHLRKLGVRPGSIVRTTAASTTNSRRPRDATQP